MIKQVDLGKPPVFIVALSWRVKEIPDAAIGKNYNGYTLVKGVFEKLLFSLPICFAQSLDLYKNDWFSWGMTERVIHLSCAIADSEFWYDHLCIKGWPAKLRQDGQYDPLTDLRLVLVVSCLNLFFKLADR